MNPLHRKALRQCRTRLKEDLDDVLPMLADLALVLTPAELSAVASRTTRTDQAELLLQVMWGIVGNEGHISKLKYG